MALDKDIIAGKVLGQGQRPAWLISQPDIGGVKLQNPDYASWPHGQAHRGGEKTAQKRRYNASHPLRFNLLYNTSESHQRIAIAASSMWKKEPRRGREAAKSGVENHAGYHAHPQL